MPAIRPQELMQEAEALAKHYSEPKQFVRALQDMLEKYANRTHRPGQAVTPPPLLPTYNVPAPVLRQIMRSLDSRVGSDPESALAIADILWEKTTLEQKKLAARLLGKISPSKPETVLERVRDWSSSEDDTHLLDILLEESLSKLRKDHPSKVLELVEAWLDAPSDVEKKRGLRATRSLIKDPKFENLPKAFKLLSPIIQSFPSNMRADVLDAFQALAERSPQETAYYLHQALIASESSNIAWLIRKTMYLFTEESKGNLRSAVKEHGTS